MPIRVAIIGSGPAGFYTASALLKTCPNCEIDIIERLPTPYGLIRGGVAPDHQTTKKIANKYEQTALMERVRFYGNVEVGRDVSLTEMREMYDAVVLAVGARSDRRLSIPGADKLGVYGSAAFVGWYNGHPDFQNLNPYLDTPSVAVIGNGNVAIDCARVLMRSAYGRARTDLPDPVTEAIDRSPINEVHVLGRRGPADAAFTNVELRELGLLTQAAPRVRAEQMPSDIDAALAGYEKREHRVRQRNLTTLADYAERPPGDKPKALHLEFYASPVEILGDGRAEAIRCERTRVIDGRAEGTGTFFEIPCGLVISAIGYRAEPLDGAPFDDARGIIPNTSGRIEAGLYAVGWIKRGPVGVISTNRPDGEQAARHIQDDNPPEGDPSKTGHQCLEALLHERGRRWVCFDEWKRIDEMEKTAAEDGAPRRKFISVDEMLSALDNDNSE
ncbi:MAG: FAD-dependent oxidoreductase [Rhodospirillaceae bacterium]|jgi:NADPH-dependent glutamate synthase beta subunit-like oxidoreductase|nr:FAD-dependent oxidoreductase [Rhodospirillaceae bacterium]